MHAAGRRTICIVAAIGLTLQCALLVVASWGSAAAAATIPAAAGEEGQQQQQQRRRQEEEGGFSSQLVLPCIFAGEVIHGARSSTLGLFEYYTHHSERDRQVGIGTGITVGGFYMHP